MRKIAKLLILIIRNSPLFSLSGFRKIRWGLYRYFYNSPSLFVDERVIIASAHYSKEAFFSCEGEVNIGADTYIDFSGGITMGGSIAISEGVKIFTHNHSIHDGSINWKNNPTVFSSLHVDDYVWIGAGAIILPNVKLLGKGSIIAAGAVVTKNTESLGIYAGNPAKKIGDRRVVQN